MDGNYTYKVNHPTMKNSLIAGMKSDSEQPTFYAGGSQVPYYLGKRGNTPDSGKLYTFKDTPAEQVAKTQPKFMTKGRFAPSYLSAGF
jgi:hypothetical protein